MKKISITDIGDFKLGNAENSEKGTGCTVIICEEGAVGGVDVRGGGPATRETDLLRSENTVNAVNAVVLSGGSAFGLEAASGVMRELADMKIGFDVGDDIVVPIVCGAALYDLPVGEKAFPDIYMGAQAVRNAFAGSFARGNHGAGTGATVGKLKGYDRAMKTGLGTFACGDGVIEVGAIAAVNAVGDIYNGAGNIIAGLRSEDGESIYGTIKTLKSMVHDKISQTEESVSFVNKSDLKEALAAAAKQFEEESHTEKPVQEVAAEELPAEPEIVAEEPAAEPVAEFVFQAPVEEPAAEFSGKESADVTEEPAEQAEETAESIEEQTETFEEPAAEAAEPETVIQEEPQEELSETPEDELQAENVSEPAPAADDTSLPCSYRSLIAQRSTNGCAELRIFGNMIVNLVELLHHGEHLLTLWKQRQVTNQHKVLDVRIQSRQDAGRTYALQYHHDDAKGNIFLGSIVLGTTEKRGCRVHGQTRQRMIGDVTNEQVDMTDVALHRHTGYLLDVAGIEHDARQTLQRAAADANASNVSDAVTVTLYKAGSRTHGHHDGFLQARLETGTQSVSHEFVRMCCRQAVDVAVDIGSTNTC